MTSSICFIVPYFGKLPNYFQLWLNSCQRNPNITWFLYIDDKTIYKFPNNVIVTYSSLSEIKKKVERLYDFKINLKSPYKLTDFKPAYGEIFAEDVSGYDYWGHCDIDLIFGNIEKILNNPIKNNYDKILTRGHFSLYKNTKDINQLYREGDRKFREVFSTSDFYSFDEWSKGGINDIFVENGADIYDEIVFSDIYVGSFLLIPVQKMVTDKIKQNSIFFWSNGNLYRIYKNNNRLCREEVLYVHLQKRKMFFNYDTNMQNNFLVVPNTFKAMSENIESQTDLGSEFKCNRPYLIYYSNSFIRVIKRIQGAIQRHYIKLFS